MMGQRSSGFSMPSRWRVAVYLNEEMQKALEQWAGEENRSVSNLAATILISAIKERQEKIKTPESAENSEIGQALEPRTIAQLVKANFYQLFGDGKIKPENLEAIASGKKPSNADLVQIARILNTKEEDLLTIRDRLFPP
jgi:hypothetical protein